MDSMNGREISLSLLVKMLREAPSMALTNLIEGVVRPRVADPVVVPVDD